MLCQWLIVPSVYRSQFEYEFAGDCVPWYAAPVLVQLLTPSLDMM